MSVVIGLGFGLLGSFLFKSVPSMKEHPVREVCLVILVAYLSYIVAEATEMSGIMTIFCCGFTLSHYAFYNISEESQVGSTLAINTIAHAAEAFLFAYLGLAMYGINEDEFSLVFAVMIIGAGAIARLIAVFLPTAIFAIVKRCDIALDCK
jgi:sodium/hydrogen exchanger-like protein 6/7